MPPDLLAAVFGSHPLMIDAQHLRAFAARVGQLDDEKLNKGHPAQVLARTSHKYAVRDGVAHLDLSGILLGSADWLLDAWGVDYTVSPHFAAAISQADADPAVRQIVIDADSPGGSVQGLQGAFEAIRDAKKPVMVAVTGMLASAALYITAAADHITAEPASMVGSIGTVVVVRDFSKLFEDAGIITHVVSTGPLKGAGTTGAPISDAHLASLQAIVDDLGAQFRAVLVEGRGLAADAVQALATGEVWLGAQAKARGLIDSVNTNALAAASKKAKEHPMDKDQILALLAAHPGAVALITANAGKPLAEVQALIAKADADAEKAALVARAEKAEADAQSAVEQLTAEKAAHEKTRGEAAAIKAAHDKLANLAGAIGKDPGAGNADGKASLTMTQAEVDAMEPRAKAKFFADGGKIQPAA